MIVLKRWLEALLAIAYPDRCQICLRAEAGVLDGYVCGGCRSVPGAVRWIEPPFCGVCGLPFHEAGGEVFECGNCRGTDPGFESARAAVVASEFMLDVIHRYKYRREMWFEPFLVDLLVGAAVEPVRAGGWSMLVPVPLHSVRRRERQFNQAERLARGLGRACGLPVEARGLLRRRTTRTQTRLTRAARRENVRGCFDVMDPGLFRGRSVLLVDDVLTTGATSGECARVLRRAGARRVGVWTLCRGLVG